MSEYGSESVREAWFLGIDTSAYTTSVALVDGRGRLIADERRLLSVPQGQKGLRQSEAVFQHVKNLPELMARLPSGWGRRVRGVAASTAPRPVPESYMPVFLCGDGAARQAAAALAVPYRPISHQEGHLWAGLWSAGFWSTEPHGAGFRSAGTAEAPGEGQSPSRPPDRFLGLHVSGGTTEIVAASWDADAPGRFAVRRLGGTEDLAAGQMVDRVGVALGLAFPAGAALERLARGGRPGVVRVPVAVRGQTVSFSGPTTAALRLLEKGADPADVALAVLECIAESLVGLVEGAYTVLNGERNGDTKGPGRGGEAVAGAVPLLAVGGVMANSLIKERLRSRCHDRGVPCFFAEPRFSVDNAVGAAVAAWMEGSGGSPSAGVEGEPAGLETREAARR